MMNLVPYGQSRAMQPTMQSLPAGQSQMVCIVCEQENFETMLAQIRVWFDGDDWDHVVLVSHSNQEDADTGKQGHAFIVLEWQESQIDAFFLRILEVEESIIDFTVFSRDSGV